MSISNDHEALEDLVRVYVSKVCRVKPRLSVGDLAALMALKRVGDRGLTITQVSRVMGTTTASSTGVCDKLEKVGWIARSRDPKDRRKVMVHITEVGVAEMLWPSQFVPEPVV